ncbi:Calsyntenin-1 [Papilio xuthus]|uniref:Calsyntenin-1 n=1 Tax=Papilio xuthus TaxID=66420 RepID=A0A0N0P9T4_PAPXU|nr:Calsyntenin-1 [Papilio xuthus]
MYVTFCGEWAVDSGQWAVGSRWKQTENPQCMNVPYLELAEPEEGYHGLIRENETLVEVTPAIRARGPLCSFLILNNKHHGEAPFEIMVIDENEARLRVRYPLNCEKRRNYKFDIAAVGCDGSYSNTVPVHITVSDVNEFAPVFSQAAYVCSVDEGKMYEELVRVEATDRDCTPHYGDVCKYEILDDNNQPFSIDNEGVIRNTEPLDYEKSHNHILSVVAYDCGMMQSAPVMVTIKVNKPCRAGWKGLAERVDYAPGSGPLALFPGARLEACTSDERCPAVTRIQALVSLRASRAGAACDRDTYSLHSQRTICGLDPKTIDLLPSPGAGNEWAKSLKPESGHDGEEMFEFDGETTSAVVPESVLGHSLGSSFAISTWLRHAPRPDQDKHRKEHVLCLADDHKMNRHHYALFVRNCRLILLLRRDFGEGDLNIFRPAEWRWKIPEVCDNEWHHYAINIRFPTVELYVDGEPYRATDGKGPEVIDDWPLHPAHGINTTLVVGACWQGTEGDMKHHLRGWLAGLGVLPGGQQLAAALRCAARCREGLSLAPDLYLKSVSVEGDGAGEVETLVRRVAYGDARAFPTPGRRNVHLDTTITCDNGRIIKARPAESYVMVLQPQTPSILLNGSGDAARDYAHFRAGLRVFADLSVRVVARDHGTLHETASQKLDSCTVSVYPALNPDHEALALRGGVLPASDVRAALSRDGVSLSGADSVHNYQKVLRSIEYSNKKPAYYLNRVFKLTCSELNGRFTSNEYIQTLTVVHPRASSSGEAAHALRPSGLADKLDAVARDKAPHAAEGLEGLATAPRVFAAHAQRSAHAADLPAPRLLDLRIEHEHAQTNHVALVMGAVATGAVVALIAVGVARARAARRPAPGPRARPLPRPDAEMAWDDSALTITVNPMDDLCRASSISTATSASWSGTTARCVSYVLVSVTHTRTTSAAPVPARSLVKFYCSLTSGVSLAGGQQPRRTGEEGIANVLSFLPAIPSYSDAPVSAAAALSVLHIMDLLPY